MFLKQKFSIRIFILTILTGIVVQLPLVGAYGLFTSQANNKVNIISTGFWVTPTITPTVTVTPSPSIFVVTPTPTATPTPSTVLSSDIFLNEFMPMPSLGDDWVEIYNSSSVSADLSGWQLVDNTSVMFTFPPGDTISGGGYRVVEVNNRLNNGGDKIFLYDNESNLIDSVSYNGSDVEEDVSIGRNPDGVGEWQSCATVSKGSSNNNAC